MATRTVTIPRKSPLQDRSKATVDAILKATTRILVKEGYDRCSTNKVALAAGVSIGSLYQYFPSKEALVGALIDRHARRMTEVVLAQASVPNRSLSEATRGLVKAMLAAHADEPSLHRVLMEQVPRTGRKQKLNEVDRQNAALIRTYLDAYCSELRPKNLDLAVFMLFHAVESITHAAVLEHPEYLRDQALEDGLVDLILRYLLP